jgi:hypothetical protein
VVGARVPYRIASLVRSALSVICGYVALVLLATVVQQFWLGGVSYRSSGNTTLVLAGIFTTLSAVIAGLVTAAIARRRLLVHALPICLAIAVETTVLYRTGRVDGPLWFEALAGASLILGVLLGTWIWQRIARAPGAARYNRH